MRIDAAGDATVVGAISGGDSKIRAPCVAKPMAEATRGITFGESLSTAMMLKTY